MAMEFTPCDDSTSEYFYISMISIWFPVFFDFKIAIYRRWGSYAVMMIVMKNVMINKNISQEVELSSTD